MSEPEVMLNVANLTKRYAAEGSVVRAANEVSFDVGDGKMFTLLGPSGCGKTTTLRCVAGLERPDSGEMSIAGTTVYSSSPRTFVPPNRRPIGMVFQSYAIWPHMTVFDNVAYPLRVGRGRTSRKEIAEKVERALGVVRLDGLESRSATRLSGGQQQRVALARAIVREPKLLLLDEPLSNLDAKLREEMREELKRLQRQLGLTSVYVTHDQSEALGLSNVVAVMKDGRVQQIGRPREIYERPANQFVAEFVGAVNWLEGEVTGVVPSVDEVEAPDDDLAERPTGVRLAVRCGVGEIHAQAAEERAPGERVKVSVRPEYVEVSAVAEGAQNEFKATVESVSFLGEQVNAVLSAESAELKVRLHPSVRLRRGQVVYARVPAAKCFVLPA